jgi:hypothetical protein
MLANKKPVWKEKCGRGEKDAEEGGEDCKWGFWEQE